MNPAPPHGPQRARFNLGLVGGTAPDAGSHSRAGKFFTALHQCHSAIRRLENHYCGRAKYPIPARFWKALFWRTKKDMKTEDMKNLKLWILAAGLMLSQLSSAHARDIYVLQWHGFAYTTNASGKVIQKQYSAKDIIKKCAQDNGITDLKALAYVYVVDEQNTEVVWAATGATVCEVFQFEYVHTDVSSADGKRVVRQAFMFTEGYDQAIGSIFAGEQSRRNSNGNLASYNYHGRFQFAFPDAGTVYSGTFTTGRRIRDAASP
jgi:hypothetical protein